MKDIEGSVEWFAGEEERQKQEEAALAAVPPIDRWFDDWFDYALAVISICCVLGMFYFMVIEERLG
jgi:hypothetical protein